MGLLILLAMTGSSQSEREHPEQTVQLKSQLSRSQQNSTGQGFGQANPSKKKK